MTENKSGVWFPGSAQIEISLKGLLKEKIRRVYFIVVWISSVEELFLYYFECIYPIYIRVSMMST